MTTASPEFHIGNTQVRILVPSRRQDGKVLDGELRFDWDSRARSKMTELFFGFTPSHVHGAFQHDDGRCTREEITVLTSGCSRATLLETDKKKALFTFAADMCGALGQESVFVSWGDDCYTISKNFKYDDVPVVQFTRLSPQAQLKHLTMGWAGIDSPAKILQVLSLDGWTLPPVPEAVAARQLPWKLCGVLDEKTGPRRAWAFLADRSGVKGALSTKSAEGPRDGDLVFCQGEPNYLEVYALVGNRVIGPRDLRLSHGQFNPVTRHLLLRILRREWPAFMEDLRRKPLDQRFFPKLQKLRGAIEEELLTQGVHASPVTRSSSDAVPAVGSRAAKKKKKGSKPSAAEEAAFRESVLIVGRMMFLRFLIQKGCIPGGIENLKRKFDALRDDFFSAWVVPLWFDLLNVEERHRDPKLVEGFGARVPYLNGGLFVPRLGERSIRLSSRLFDEAEDVSFFRLFADFEFSLNEHEGSEHSLKIDPSFFGKALESFNPDLEKKRFGVHYTPKPVARALAAESIVYRTAQLAGVNASDLHGLLGGRPTINARKAREVRKVLEELRIIDPAVGSGVLLWAALRVLMDLDSACDGLIRGADGYQPGSDEWGARSRHFVCNCLYGVDISDEAVELSRLRLWLAVALSEDDPAALPDLELNICRGDSLLPDALLPAGTTLRAGATVQLKLTYDEVSHLASDLRTKTKAYIEAGSASPDEQRKLLGEVHQIRRRLLQLDHDVGRDPSLNWNLFFPHVFGDQQKQGFDVVIANPPYVRVQQIDKKLIKSYRTQWTTIAKGSADLSFAFIELALKKLAAIDGGQIAFIQPNFRHHDAADGIRRLLTGHDPAVPAKLRLWVDFDDVQVFPTASNYVALLFAERTPSQHTQETFAYTNPREGSWDDPERGDDIGWLRPNGTTLSNEANGEWLTVPTDLRGRVLRHKASGVCLLGDVAEVDVGVQTSKDDVFLFESSAPPGDRLCTVFSQAAQSHIELEAGILRRCLKGAAGADFLLLFPYDSDGKLLLPDRLAKRFPKAWAYLQRMKPLLEARESDGFKCADWYRFGRSQGTVACSRPKLLVSAMLSRPAITSDPLATLAFTASGKGGGGAWAVYPRDADARTLALLEESLLSDVAWDHYLAYGSPQKGGWRGIDQGVLRSMPLPRLAR
jgi:hypothetical protein